MSVTEKASELVIFGTTTPAQEDALPMRLSPVYKRLADAAIFLPQGEEAEGVAQLVPVEPAWVEDQRAAGELIVFESPLPARAGCWLIQLHAEESPSLLEPGEARRQLAKAGKRALEEVQRSIAQADLARAERFAWYASRALPQDPLPLVALVWLLRRTGLSQQQIAHLEEDRDGFAEQARKRAEEQFKVWCQVPSTSSFNQRRMPDYLRDIDEERSFLPSVRRSLFQWSPEPAHA